MAKEVIKEDIEQRLTEYTGLEYENLITSIPSKEPNKETDLLYAKHMRDKGEIRSERHSIVFTPELNRKVLERMKALNFKSFNDYTTYVFEKEVLKDIEEK